jgi:hypothetical protein
MGKGKEKICLEDARVHMWIILKRGFYEYRIVKSVDWLKTAFSCSLNNATVTSTKGGEYHYRLIDSKLPNKATVAGWLVI